MGERESATRQMDETLLNLVIKSLKLYIFLVYVSRKIVSKGPEKGP